MTESGGAGPKVLVGGSDAHRASRIGTVYTSAPGRSKPEYLRNVREGRCRVGGSPPGLGPLVWDVYAIINEYYGRLLTDLGSMSWHGRIPHLPGAIVLAPAVLAGVPFALTFVQAMRQMWIARFGRWDALAVAPVDAMERAGGTEPPARPAACDRSLSNLSGRRIASRE